MRTVQITISRTKEKKRGKKIEFENFNLKDSSVVREGGGRERGTDRQTKRYKERERDGHTSINTTNNGNENFPC